MVILSPPLVAGKFIFMVNKNKTVLIVEDDEILLRALYLQFEGAGYTISSATDGEIAVKIAQRIIPDIVLLDLIMPKMDGFEVLHILKSDPKTKEIPVIVLSNLGESTDIQKAKSLGAVEYFVKADIRLDELQKKVAEIINS